MWAGDMSEALPLIVIVCVGVAIGWWTRRRGIRLLPKVAKVAALVIGVPVLAFAVAVLIGSDTLAMLAGLSMMVLLPLAGLSLAGLGLGWLLAPNMPEEQSAFPPQYQQPAASVPAAQPAPPKIKLNPRQRMVLFVMPGVGSLFWVGLWLGFTLHDQQPPAGLTEGVVPAALVLLATTVLGIRWLWRRRDSVTQAVALPDVSFNLFANAKHKQWLDSLAADPRRQHYAARIRAGDTFWTPERIEYDLDPNATTCCAHLAPIESAMRTAGMEVRMNGIGVATAQCRVDATKLSAGRALPASVRYEEMHIPDRSMRDPPDARVHCDACSSSIWVKHPDVATFSTPVFPN